MSAARARRLVGLVPQTPADLLYRESARAELAQANAESGTGTTARAALNRLAPGITHPPP
ncbi:hypothetical protein [Streptomyces sp. NPDC087294]|uniref:hypothetical protein n=1 Tax=Streptomyces sp. NPDC087294 TaxID=3365777 RepID=UPI003815704B